MYTDDENEIISKYIDDNWDELNDKIVESCEDY
jgi:hypothetical protein